MTFSQIIVSQFTDPFRIALLAALIWTMLRTRGATGTLIPLAAGIAFVAVIIPSTMGAGAAVPFLDQVLAGLVSNTVITGVLLGLWEAVRRLRG